MPIESPASAAAALATLATAGAELLVGIRGVADYMGASWLNEYIEQ